MLGMAGVIPDGKGGAVKIAHRIKPGPDCKCDLIVAGDPADWQSLTFTCTKCGSVAYLVQVTQEDILAMALEAGKALEDIARVRPVWSRKDLEVIYRAET